MAQITLNPLPKCPRVSHNPLMSIRDHPLCPHIIAMDRFTHWMTPNGIDQIKTLLLLFLPSLVTSSYLLLCNSVVPGTLSNYAPGLSQFMNFCDEFNVPELLCMPASEQLLVLFIMAHGAFHAALGMMRHWLLGLELWHHINGAPWFGAHALTRATKAAGHLAPTKS